MKLKFIEELRGIHTGEEIWVIGSGPSLDDYPINFFKDKVCIGVNWVFSVFVNIGDRHKKFPTKAFYSVHEHRPPADWILKNRPGFLSSCFFLLPPRRIQTGHSKMVWWEDYPTARDQSPYYMRWGLRGKKHASATYQDFADTAKCIMHDKSVGQCEYVCRGTTLHWAAQAAVVLGARKVYLVGHSTRGGHMLKHGSLYRTKARAAKKYGKRTEPWRTGTRAMARAFAPHGVEIVRHYYGKGEQAP